MRRCWANFQCQGVLLTWLTVGQGPIVLSVGAGGGCLDIFSLINHFSFLSPSLWETARYRLKYCLKGPLSPKQPNLSESPFKSILLYSVDLNISDGRKAECLGKLTYPPIAEHGFLKNGSSQAPTIAARVSKYSKSQGS